MPYNIEVRERPAQLTVAINAHSPMRDLPQVIPQSMEVVAKYLEQIGQKPSGAPFVSYHNMDMQNLDVKIGFLSSENVPGNGNIQAGSIPGGRAASCLHVGPYTTLSAAHAALHGWIDDHAYQSEGSYYEVYLNDPAKTPPDQLQTEVFTLLKTV